MSNTNAYPTAEFLRDFHEWMMARARCRDAYRRAELLLSVRYQADLQAYIYRVNRFKCILREIHEGLPQLVQDRIAIRGAGEMDFVPQELLIALHEWYCSVPENRMDPMPHPDWPWVLARFDELWHKVQ